MSVPLGTSDFNPGGTVLTTTLQTGKLGGGGHLRKIAIKAQTVEIAEVKLTLYSPAVTICTAV